LDDVAIGGRRIGFTSCIREHVSTVTHRNEPLHISLLASSPALRLFERDLIFDFAQRGYGVNASVGRLFRLMKIQLERAATEYDFILLDCAPGISALTEVTIRLADLIIVPTIPDFVSTYGLRTFCNSSKPAPGALAAPPPPQRPWGGKPLGNNELYSGRKKRWWDDKRFSGAKKNDDQIIRSHDKSASVGMRGFDAGAKGAWVNPNAEYHPEQDDRAWTRASNRTAREGEKEVQKPYDDPMGTPKSWSNPSDAAPDDELGIRRLGRRLVEEGEIERYKPKKGEEDD
jgi:hypothetical protein